MFHLEQQKKANKRFLLSIAISETDVHLHILCAHRRNHISLNWVCYLFLFRLFILFVCVVASAHCFHFIAFVINWVIKAIHITITDGLTLFNYINCQLDSSIVYCVWKRISCRTMKTMHLSNLINNKQLPWCACKNISPAVQAGDGVERRRTYVKMNQPFNIQFE